MTVEPLAMEALRNLPATLQPIGVGPLARPHLNLLTASLTMGGAERCVLDVVRTLDGGRATGNLFVMREHRVSYSIAEFASFKVTRPLGRDRRARMRRVGAEVLSSPNPTVVTHLIRSGDLARLWEMGVDTIPVFHNSEQGWHEPPDALEHERVPFVVAVCGSVADQLRAAGLRRPISVLRHELGARQHIGYSEEAREGVRRRHEVPQTTLLIGMVGQFKAHKSYVRAIRVLDRLRKRRPVKLLIAGGWDHDYGAGRSAYVATLAQAEQLGVSPDVIYTGPVEDIEAYYSAFDLFLNTSTYEGMSIATLEAASCGCPIVTADVGGQREAVSERDILVAEPADIDAYVEAIENLVERGRPAPPSVPRQSDLIPRIWAATAEYGQLSAGPPNGGAEILFVTSNLNPGGAQRSLVNLVCAAKLPAWVCVLDRILGEGFIGELDQHGIPCVSLGGVPNQIARVEDCLELARRLGVRTLCFWNTDPAFKLLAAKILVHANIRLVDVSPGPMLFEELEATANLQRRLAFTVRDYIARLDVLVSKYTDATPARYMECVRNEVVIPNGVAQPPPGRPIDSSLLPPGADPDYAFVTCCRLAPNKRLEWLVEMMTDVAALEPRATLTIVGGVDPRHVVYLERVRERIAKLGLTNIWFAGPNPNVFGFLPAFRVFAMASRAQGCPNASLEAMACGLPVVANSDGGTAEQVIDRVTGYLLADDDPSTMARLIVGLLRRPDEARRLGAMARALVQQRFTMDRMTLAYERILKWR